jgi:antitoxin Phd
MNWQLQNAKAHFSELLRVCAHSGPQTVSVHGKEEAVVISMKDYQRLVGPKLDFIDFMNRSPLKGLDLAIERDPSSGRDIDI